MSIAGIFRRWVLVSAVTGVLALIQVPGVRAQAVQPVQMPPSPSQPVQMPPNPNPNQPVPMAPSPGPNQPVPTAPIGAPAAEAGTAPAGPVLGAPAAEPSTEDPPQAPLHSPTGLSPLEVIRRSLFDSIYLPADQARWSPLTLGTFFTEGWDVPYVNPTAGDGGLAGAGGAPRAVPPGGTPLGAPRQGWINSFGATFFRAWFFAFAYAQGVNSKVGNTYLGEYEIFIPFNRRYELEIRDPFIVSDKGGTSGTYHGNFGDQQFINRFMLSESKNFGQLFRVGVSVPTGRQENHNLIPVVSGGVAAILPYYEFWWNFWDKWVLKGETGPNIIINHSTSSGYTSYHNLLSIGRYFPGSKESWFQQWWFYLVADAESTIAGTPRRFTNFSLLPGMRCKMTDPIFTNIGTGLWYFFASVNVPMTGPQALSYAPIFAILYDY